MLLNLHVKNLAIIDEVDVYFSDHLNILTGETGAGKSIIIGSINIALGGKVSLDMIRTGADYALVELVFQLEDQGSIEKLKHLDVPLEDGQIILSRKIMKGRTIAKINGEIVTASLLKEIAGILIDIHGQHEHQSLFHKNKHLEIVDRYGKEQLYDVKAEYETCYIEYRRLRQEWEENQVPEEERLRELSFWEYERNEIASAKLVDGEDQTLETQYKRLANGNAITEGLSLVYGYMEDKEDSVSENLARSLRTISKMEEYDEKIGDFSNQLAEIESLVSDFNRETADYMSGISCDREEFYQVEARVNLLHNLKAKYGNTIKEILTYGDEIEKKIIKYQDYEHYIMRIKDEFHKKEKQLEKVAEKISVIRKKKARELEVKIIEALKDLNFIDVQFAISFEKTDRFTESGCDQVEFIISTNPGEEKKPLSKVASGGELSRIMLAIKSVLAENDAIDTLIFDEIDVGISGRTAQKVSEKLSVIASQHQVICITHLPQITAMADEHYVIEKNSDGETTKTTIRLLKETDSIEELARILGGAKITDGVLASAKEMKELATKTKIY